MEKYLDDIQKLQNEKQKEIENNKIHVKRISEMQQQYLNEIKDLNNKIIKICSKTTKPSNETNWTSIIQTASSSLIKELSKNAGKYLNYKYDIDFEKYWKIIDNTQDKNSSKQ